MLGTSLVLVLALSGLEVAVPDRRDQRDQLYRDKINPKGESITVPARSRA